MGSKGSRSGRVLVLALFFCAYWLFTQKGLALNFGSANIELRFSGFLPMVGGLVFGMPGALACAGANLVSDLFNNFTSADVLGSLGVFLMGFMPYKLWHTLFRVKNSPPEFLYSGASVLKFAAIAFISSVFAAGAGGIGGEISGEYSFGRFFGAVMPQYYILSVICGMLLFRLLICVPLLHPEIPRCAYEKKYVPARYISDYIIAAAGVSAALALSLHGNNSVLTVIFLLCCAYLVLAPMHRSATASGVAAVYCPHMGLRSRFIIAFLILLLTVTAFYMYEIIPHFMREVSDAARFFNVVLRNVAVYVTVMLLMLFFMLKWIGKNVSAPIIRISEYAEHFIVSGNMESRPLDVTGAGTEIDSLARSVNTMSADIKNYAEAQRVRAKQEAQTAAEMRAAAAIQLSMLPNPSDVSGAFKIGAYIKPAREVGGDLFDFSQRENGLFAAVADVSGKGITAALFMIRAKTLLNSGDSPGALQDLSRTVTHLNKELAKGNDSLMFVTMFSAYLDAAAKTAVFVNAGHNAPLYWDGNKTRRYDEVPGVALGVNPNAAYKAGTLPIAPGFKLLLYTDGVTEAQNAAGEFFGDNRLTEAANSAFLRGLPPQGVTEAIRDALDAFTGSAPQFDDITLLCAEYTGEYDA